MANIQFDAIEEQRVFDLEVAKIETWWKSSKQAQITRCVLLLFYTYLK